METRKHSQTLLEGAMILGAAAFLSKVIGLLYRIPITNVLGDIGNSYYSIAYNIYVILITISAVGLPAAISKLVAERIEVKAYKEAHRVYKVALTYSTILSMILAIGMWFGANAISILFFNSKDVALPIRALAPTVVIVTMMAAMRLIR
jgi:stage V sporulation protein B